MEANNGKLRGFKGSLYEGGIRTPWIVSWPARFEGGRVLDTPVISIDILPTVLDALGHSSSDLKKFDGQSLLPLLTSKTKPGTPHAILEQRGSQSGVGGSARILEGPWHPEQS